MHIKAIGQDDLAPLPTRGFGGFVGAGIRGGDRPAREKSEVYQIATNVGPFTFVVHINNYWVHCSFPQDYGVFRDQICTVQGLKFDYVRQVDFWSKVRAPPCG